MTSQLIRYRPAPPLDAFVAWFWWSRRDQPEAGAEHVLPSGSAQMIFALHEAPFTCLPHGSSSDTQVWSRAIVHGPQGRFYRCGSKPAGAVAGVAFRPGAAGAILGTKMSELADRHVRVDELWGARGNQLREQLLAAGGGEAVFRVLESALTARIVDPRPMHPAVAAALASRRGARVPSRVAEIERDAGYSAKHFIALFRAAVGLTPKHYCRVLRFNTAVRCLASAKGENLADLAASAGYADQPHMTREFRDFAGVTPTQYQPRSLSGILHHRVPSASTHAIGGR